MAMTRLKINSLKNDRWLMPGRNCALADNSVNHRMRTPYSPSKCSSLHIFSLEVTQAEKNNRRDYCSIQVEILGCTNTESYYLTTGIIDSKYYSRLVTVPVLI